MEYFMEDGIVMISLVDEQGAKMRNAARAWNY